MAAPKRPVDRKSRVLDRALVVLIFGLVLFMPPIALIFVVDFKLFGVPLALLYLFVVWATLILVTAWLAPRLDDRQPDESDP